ncbi:hypothetical protein [Actinacidiphila yanglinensis]|nr:hypothetical protein [Actinacidiphila yanglinensis]
MGRIATQPAQWGAPQYQVPKMTAAGFAGTFYVLSSDDSLHDGTTTCDHLLVYG